MENDFWIFLVLITIVCFLLIIVVMVQNSKGGGLSSSFGNSQSLGGVQKTNDFLEKSTWTLAGLLFILILLSSLSFPEITGGNNSKVIDNTKTDTPKTETSVPAKPAGATTTTEPVTEPASK